MSTKFENVPTVTIVRIPKFKAVSTGYYTVEEDNRLWDSWFNWIDEHENLLPWGLLPHGLDFALTKNGKLSKICAIKDDVKKTDVAPYEIIEMKGGLYATAISYESYSDSLLKFEDRIMKWLKNSNFIYDEEREIMGENINDDEEIYKGLECYQFLKYVPIKLRTF